MMPFILLFTFSAKIGGGGNRRYLYLDAVGPTPDDLYSYYQLFC